MKKYPMKKADSGIVNWMNCIWLTDLPANAKYLACYLRKYMNDNQDMAWPSYARMIEETGLSRQSIAKYLEVLEEEGWVMREREFGKNTVYTAVLPKAIMLGIKNFDSSLQELVRVATESSSSGELDLVPQANTNKQVNKQVINKGSEEQFPLPDDLNHEAWEEWLAYRRAVGFKAYKKNALSMGKVITNLIKLSGGNKALQMGIVQQSIANQYQGLFPLKGGVPVNYQADSAHWNSREAWEGVF